MSSALHRLFCLCFLLATLLQAGAQTAVQASPHLEQVPRVFGIGSLLRGVNAGVAFSAVHDSSIGWYAVTTPAVSYTFTRHYSADASFSVYPYRLVQNQSSSAPNSPQLVAVMGDTGDTLIGFHASFNPQIFHTTTTASLNAPTGNRSDGLGTGKVTFDFSDHLDRFFKQTGFLLDIGGGDSAGLFNSLVTKDYNSVGPLAHFQAGVAFWLPGKSYFQSVAYEQLPFGSQTIYTTVNAPGRSNRIVATSGGLSEDNGFTTLLGIPLSDHIILSGYYNRSLRHDLDTTAVNLTFVLRAMPHSKKLSLIDRALREAEGASR